jgi:hypothetical protein
MTRRTRHPLMTCLSEDWASYALMSGREHERCSEDRDWQFGAVDIRLPKTLSGARIICRKARDQSPSGVRKDQLGAPIASRFLRLRDRLRMHQPRVRARRRYPHLPRSRSLWCYHRESRAEIALLRRFVAQPKLRVINRKPSHNASAWILQTNRLLPLRRPLYRNRAPSRYCERIAKAQPNAETGPPLNLQP